MLNPLMLLGLLALGIPIVIHLIQRQKLQPRLLATLRFLEETDVANAFAPVPRDLLQLALRLLLLTVFVLLMVRLTAPGSRLGARTMTVILDGSMSMQAAAGPQPAAAPGRPPVSLFDQHKAWIRDLAESMGPDDEMSLTLVADEVQRETGFLRDKEELKSILSGLEMTDEGGRAILPAVERALATSASVRRGEATNTCVLIFSDHQLVNYVAGVAGQSPPWQAQASSAQAERIRALLARGRVKLFLVGQPAGKPANIAVQDGRFTPQRAYVGSSAKVTAQVRNWSEEKQDVTVGFAQGANAGESRPLSLDAGETAGIDLAHFFESSNDSACRVVLGDPGAAAAPEGSAGLPTARDALAVDNIFHVPMRMRERRQVLLVAPPAAATEGATRASAAGPDLLGYALNPGEALGLGTGTNVSVKRITPNLIERVPLPLYSAVVLYAVSELPERSIKDLVAYVKGGGGLYLIVDRAVARERFNETFAPLLAGFRLGGWKESPEPLAIDTNEAALTDPMLLPLVRQEWGETQDLRFSAYFVPQSHGEARCALRASARGLSEGSAAPAGRAETVPSADWLMATVRMERGCVCVQLFSCDLADTTMPRSALFVPMVQEVLANLAPEPSEFATDAIRVGETVRMDVPELRGATGAVDLKGPTERRFDLLPGEPGVVEVSGISRAGSYALSHPEKEGMRPRWLAVNPVPSESDLTRLSDEEIVRAFGRVGVERLSYEAIGSRFTHRQEVLPVALALLLAAFVVEAAVGAWQSVRKGAARR